MFFSYTLLLLSLTSKYIHYNLNRRGIMKTLCFTFEQWRQEEQDNALCTWSEVADCQWVQLKVPIIFWAADPKDSDLRIQMPCSVKVNSTCANGQEMNFIRYLVKSVPRATAGIKLPLSLSFTQRKHTGKASRNLDQCFSTGGPTSWVNSSLLFSML
jgi:hypothetical protein